MKYVNGKAEGVKIAYVGGGSRGWAWNLMNDLVKAGDMSGDVYLYDIDYEAAQDNVIIGHKYNEAEGAQSHWNYFAAKTAEEALTGADFVVVSILPGTFDEMESDVHTPEKYGIYQSVGDTSGPGGIVRAMRTLPMFEEIALNIKKYCPDAWVINYTNPMTLCVRAMYRAFPEIKAFGCCHEVFGTQKLLIDALKEIKGIEVADRRDIEVNVTAVNHFTWLTEARYKDIDLFPVWAEFVERHYEEGFNQAPQHHWINDAFRTNQKVKFDLFRRYGYIAAAGDRHLSEFCPGSWYLKDTDTVWEWGASLTTVASRKEKQAGRLEKSIKLRTGEEPIELIDSGEEGVDQIRALLGLTPPLVTNVNLPNYGQIPNLPLGAVVETNAVFRSGTVVPVMAGPLPQSIHTLVSHICTEQELVSEGIAERNLDKIFAAFAGDPLVTCSHTDAKKLFKEMVENTKHYLSMYDLSSL